MAGKEAKRDQDYRYEGHEERLDSGEGSSQLYRSASYTPEYEEYDRRDQELERLRKQVRDLELEVWGRRRRRIMVNPPKTLAVRGKVGESPFIVVVPTDQE